MEARDPQGNVWKVKRRWLPWRLKRRDPDDVMNGADPTFDVDDLVIGIAIFVVVLLIVVVAPVIIVMAVLVAELLLLLLLLPLFVLLRMVWVGRWPIEVWSHRAGRSHLVHAEAVRGWRLSRERMDALAQALRTGGFPTP